MAARKTPIISKRIQDRYVPALTWVGDPGQYWGWTYDARGKQHMHPIFVTSWLLMKDWTLKDGEKKAIAKALWDSEWGNDPKAVDSFLNGAPLSYGGHDRLCTVGGYWENILNKANNVDNILNRYTPCDACGKMTAKCKQCGECPGCKPDSIHNSCGCCEAHCEPCRMCGKDECCCQCPKCHQCDVKSKLCGHCGKGRNCVSARKGHCTCVICNYCENRCTSICAECGRGNCHCVCNRCEGIRETGQTWPSIDRPNDDPSLAARRMPHLPPMQRRKFNSHRFVGVEAEFNNCGGFKPIRTWCGKWGASVHRDGSCGWEAVSSPAAGDYLVSQLAELGEAFTASRAACDRRCGLHVHVDARDLKWADMARLLQIWTRLEPALFILAGEHRLLPSSEGATHFCQPWAKAFSVLDNDTGKADPKGAILRVLYSSRNEAAAKDVVKGEWAGEGPEKKARYRYHSLNLAPWIARFRKQNGVHGKKIPARDATVEFRLHEGTLDPNELIHWAKLCARLVEYAATCTQHDIARFNRSAMRTLMRRIAPDCKDWILSKVKAHREMEIADRQVGYHPMSGYTIGLNALAHIGEQWELLNAAGTCRSFTHRGRSVYRASQRYTARLARENGWRAAPVPAEDYEVTQDGSDLPLRFNASPVGMPRGTAMVNHGSRHWAESWANSRRESGYSGVEVRRVDGGELGEYVAPAATARAPDTGLYEVWYRTESGIGDHLIGNFYSDYSDPENPCGHTQTRGTREWAESVCSSEWASNHDCEIRAAAGVDLSGGEWEVWYESAGRMARFGIATEQDIFPGRIRLNVGTRQWAQSWAARLGEGFVARRLESL